MTHHIDNDGYSLACESTGSGARIVWVDPALGSSLMRPMKEAIEALSERFEVVTYDRRGRGQNAVTSDLSVRREVADLAAVVGEVGDVRAVVGFSSGAALVLHAAAQLDVPLLVLVEPAVDGAPDDSGLRERLQASIESGDNEGAVLAFYEAIGVPKEMTQDLVGSEVWPAIAGTAPTALVDLDLAHVPDAVLTNIEKPVHVIVSDGSPREITEMSDQLAERLAARVWRESGGWHGVDARALADRLGALVQPSGIGH